MKTLHQMHLHRPALVLVPDTFVASADGQTTSGGKRVNSTSVLVEAIEDEFPGVPVEAVGRKYWNETSGTCSAPDFTAHTDRLKDSTSFSNSASKTMKEPVPSLRL